MSPQLKYTKLARKSVLEMLIRSEDHLRERIGRLSRDAGQTRLKARWECLDSGRRFEACLSQQKPAAHVDDAGFAF